MELQVGDRIKINGWVMLKGLDAGKTYEVYKISTAYNDIAKRELPRAYFFANVLKNGQYGKQRTGHSIHDIDRTIIAAAHSANNIEILKKDLYSVLDWEGREVREIQAWNLLEAKAAFSDLGYAGNQTQPFSLVKKSAEPCRYSILMQNEDGSTETLEDYNDLDPAKQAIDEIRSKGYHQPEHSNDEKDRIYFNAQGRVSLSLVKDFYGPDGQYNGKTEPVEYPGIHFYLGTQIKESAIGKNFLETFILHTEAMQPRLLEKINQIDEWTKRQHGMLVGENTLICTVDETGRIFHVVADENIKLAEEIDGYLTGVHHYFPDRAIEVAKAVKDGLRGSGAEMLSVKPVNMREYQALMKERFEMMYEANRASLERCTAEINRNNIKEIAAGATVVGGLTEAISSLNSNQSKSSELKQ